MIGVAASNSRPRPFSGTANFIRPGSTTSDADRSYVAYLNGQYVFHDTVDKDTMTSSSALSGYSDAITTNAISGDMATITYENGRYFTVDDFLDTAYTGTSLGNSMTSFSTDDIRTPVIWYAAASAWLFGGDNGAGSCMLKSSTNGTTWGSRTAPTTLRILGLATDGTRMVTTSEGSAADPHEIKYTTSTSVTSLVWSSSTSPFNSQRDVSRLKYHPAKDTWTCSTFQAGVGYSTNGGASFTSKDFGWTSNGEVHVEWVPWHNMWVAVQDTGDVAYSNTPDIAGTWTVISGAIDADACPILIDPKKAFIMTGTANNKIYWSV